MNHDDVFAGGPDDDAIQVGDRVEVTKDGKTFWKAKVVRIDDFGLFWCSTWWQEIWSETTLHEPSQVRKIDD